MSALSKRMKRSNVSELDGTVADVLEYGIDIIRRVVAETFH